VAHHATAAIGKDKIRSRGEKRLEFRLDRLRDQTPGAAAKDFGERIVDSVFPAKGNNLILFHGVTLLSGRFGWLQHQPRYAAFLTPSPTFRHSS
jgi:hypothetical protein